MKTIILYGVKKITEKYMSVNSITLTKASVT